MLTELANDENLENEELDELIAWFSTNKRRVNADCLASIKKVGLVYGRGWEERG